MLGELPYAGAPDPNAEPWAGTFQLPDWLVNIFKGKPGNPASPITPVAPQTAYQMSVWNPSMAASAQAEAAKEHLAQGVFSEPQYYWNLPEFLPNTPDLLGVKDVGDKLKAGGMGMLLGIGLAVVGIVAVKKLL